MTDIDPMHSIEEQHAEQPLPIRIHLDKMLHSLVYKLNNSMNCFEKKVTVRYSKEPVKVLVDTRYFYHAVNQLLEQMMHYVLEEAYVDISLKQKARDQHFGVEISIHTNKFIPEAVHQMKLGFTKEVFSIHEIEWEMRLLEHTDILDIRILLPQFRVV